MIINVTTTNQVQKPIRVSLCKGNIYLCLRDVIDMTAFKDKFVLSDDNIEKIISIIGEENFELIYFTDNFNPLYVKDTLGLEFISHKGLKKLIDYPEMDEYLIKIDLARINDYITTNKRMIETLTKERYNTNMALKRKPVKKETRKKSDDDKMKEINHHINEMKKHLDIVIKLQEELMKGE